MLSSLYLYTIILYLIPKFVKTHFTFNRLLSIRNFQSHGHDLYTHIHNNRVSYVRCLPARIDGITLRM